MNKRRSAKAVVHELAEKWLNAQPSLEREQKLDILETIASKMSWFDLFSEIKYHRLPVVKEQKRPWWVD